jgi:hypothetical protein
MPIDFPNSPTVGQVYTYQGKSWIWNGSAWDVPRALNEIGAVRTFANAADRTAAIPSPTEGILTYLNDIDTLEVHDGTAFVPAISTGAWTAFTPTWTALTVGNGVYNRSHFTRMGKTVIVAIDFEFGSTTAVTGNITLSLPASIGRASQLNTGLAQLLLTDTSVSTQLGIPIPRSNNSRDWLIRGASGTPVATVNTSATSPFTWATGDKIIFGATYEAV